MGDKRIRVGISGATGRSGSLVVRALKEFPIYELRAARVSPGSSLVGKRCVSAEDNHGREVIYLFDLETFIRDLDLVIDFSTPSASIEAARACAKRKIPILIATTGHTDKEREEIKRLSSEIPILFAANTSLSVHVLHELSKLAARLLGTAFDIEILELHHRQKKDAPSGTALSVGRELAEQGHLALKTSRDGRDALRKQDEIGFATLRGGDAPGEHTVFFLGDGERIEISQRVRDRTVFARGALSLGAKLVGMPARLYSVRDLYLTNS